MRLDDPKAIVTEVGTLGSSTSDTSETNPPEDPIALQEHDSTVPFPLSKADADFIEDLGGDSNPLTIRYTADGTASIHSSSYVGVTALPSGARIEVTPKETVSSLVYLLQYAFDVTTSTIDLETGLTAADTFIDAFGALFQAELSEVLQQGIRRDYVRVRGIEQSIRGRLDVQRQIERPTPVPTDFAVEYDTYTSDTPLNRAVLAATQILTVLVEDETLSANLSHQANRLEQFVSFADVTAGELKTIELTRLDIYYEDLLNLVEIVLSRRFFEDIAIGQRESFGLFVDMNDIFEKAVERAFRESAQQITDDWIVEGQGDIGDVITGPHAVDMTPDFVLKDADERTLLVGDAKWKTGALASDDVYQITSYMLADGAPGLLVYPQHGGPEDTSRVHRGEEEYTLRSVELPTATEADRYETYCDQFVEAAEGYLRNLIEDGPTPSEFGGDAI